MQKLKHIKVRKYLFNGIMELKTINKRIDEICFEEKLSDEK